MKQGTFNKILKIGNLIIKISKEHSSISSEMAKMGSDDIKQYEQDIKMTGVNTSKVYLYLKRKKKTLIIQEYISGYTIQEFFENENIKSVEKLKIFKELILLYQKTLKNNNLCLDWNLKNFIISNGKIVYIDYVPALYKNCIEKVESERLNQYIESYLDRQVQLAGIISYAIVPFLKEDKKSLRKIYFSMINCIEEILNIKLDSSNIPNHVYIQKINLILDYLNSSQTYLDFISQYNSVTMEKTAVKLRYKED